MATTESAAVRSLVLPAVALAVAAGGLAAAQGRFNGDLGSAGAGALVASWVSYAGTVGMLLLVTVLRRRAAFSVATVRRDGRWWWFAVGTSSIPIVVFTALGVPHVGVAVAAVCTVAGQTVAGLAFDARGWGVDTALGLTPRRLLAGITAIAGLALAVVSGSGSGVGVGLAVGLGVALFLSGLALAIQQAGNGRITQISGDAVLAGVTSCTGGFVGITAVVGVVAALGRLGEVAMPGADEWWLYLGGPLGAFITVASAWAVRHLGTFALTLAAVGGQMVTAVVLDVARGVGVRWPTYAAIAAIAAATLLVVLPQRANAALAHRAPPVSR